MPERSPDESVSHQAPQAIPIGPVLDLHSFQPREVPDLLAEYLGLCRERNLLEVRVVHGKGIGQIRLTVHKALSRLAAVRSFSLAGEAYGGQGATIVHLAPPDDQAETPDSAAQPSAQGTRNM